MIKQAIQQVCPPIVWRGLRSAKNQCLRVIQGGKGAVPPAAPASDKQDLDMYWDEEFAKVLETWGEGNAWNELQLLLVNCEGKVLDIACGTGKTIELAAQFPRLQVHGCDISDLLIEKARKRGIPSDRLKVCDATKTGYADKAFDFSYSVGSLEHFTESLITDFIKETHRITRGYSFHFMPVSKSGKNEGWMKTVQSFFNNSPEWWVEKFKTVYPTVHVFDSKWEDFHSNGKWFVCIK